MRVYLECLGTANLITWGCTALVNKLATFWHNGIYTGLISEPYTAFLSQ